MSDAEEPEAGLEPPIPQQPSPAQQRQPGVRLGYRVLALLVRSGRDGLVLLVRLCYNSVALLIRGIDALISWVLKHHMAVLRAPGRAARLLARALHALVSNAIVRHLSRALSHLVNLHVSAAVNNDLDDAAKVSLTASSCLALLFNTLRCMLFDSQHPASGCMHRECMQPRMRYVCC